ncbi:hypothetical protein Fmac_008366 [Flemingia macrophylla]|uniref:Uncharacterized protein n=1 Tax=Flemingia macrophylla TaxID=520843 RepID=A0ABD1MXQ4_9FABA
MATDTFTEIRKLESKLDTLVNLVTKLAVNQNSTSPARVFSIRSSNDHRTNACPFLRYSGKSRRQLDALVNLVTQLAVNQKSASTPRVFGIRSSNDHHTNVCSSLQQSGVNEHPEAYRANHYSRPPQQQRPDT